MQERRINTHNAATSKRIASGLYLVATPIGNQRDITLRALDVLQGADLIACEDTRVTRRLLGAYEITTPTKAYHDHNAARVRPGLLSKLRADKSIALVSDAGTPLISDPGYKLVRAAIDADIPVIPVPGPSAGISALLVSGLPTDRFVFVGFLPTRSVARRRALEKLQTVDATVVAYESTSRLRACLADWAHVCGDRLAAVGRELTKLHEEVRRGTLVQLAEHYAAVSVKGEAVIVVGPPPAATWSAGEIDAQLRVHLAAGTLRDAVAHVAQHTGAPRADIYKRALTLRRERP